ncbi:MAG: DUF3784 domain-containing protein [Lachnospiraceae bacterium]
MAVALFVYVSFTARNRGIILSNTYLLATPEERKKIDIQGEYRLVTRVFGLLAFTFLFVSIFIFTEQRLFLYLTFILVAVVIIYAIYESIQTEKRNI